MMMVVMVTYSGRSPGRLVLIDSEDKKIMRGRDYVVRFL